MRIQLCQKPGIAGKTLFVVIVVTSLLAVLLAAYLTLLGNVNSATVRSQGWNQTVPVVEAGLEDALTHLNVHGLTNLACDGWTLVSGTTNMFKIQRTLGDSVYLVVISNWVAGVTNGATNKPTIESRGYVAQSGLASAPTPYVFAAAGTPRKSYLSRGVRVTSEFKVPMRGLVCRSTLQGQSDPAPNNVRIDSYDSSNPLYSSNGLYVAGLAKQNGFVGTTSRSAGTMQLQGPTKIVGNVGTGAAGVLAMVSPAVVGDLVFVNNPVNGGQVQAGHLQTALTMPFPNATVPFAGGFTPSSGIIGGTNYDYVLNGGNYRMASGLIMGSKKMIVTDSSALNVIGSFEIDGGSIIIAPNVKFSMYVSGSFVAKGTSKINAGGKAPQLSYYGLPAQTSFQVTDSPILVGTFYAPSAQAQFQKNTILCGAGIFNDMQFQHSFQFHFDESLHNSNQGYFIVTSWNEMTPQQVAHLPNGVYLTLP
jgi:hypothetical protein